MFDKMFDEKIRIVVILQGFPSEEFTQGNWYFTFPDMVEKHR